MILKDKPQTSSASLKLDAGIKQEHDVAFYLRRAYRDRDNVLVLNDLRIEHNGETAQIDHLIVYTYGFIVVESKSIRGEVNINEYGEWSRSYKEKWSGMPSPLKQAELQITSLKQYLCANTEKVIGKFLGIQQGLGARCYDVLSAISSDAIIDRNKAPKDLAAKLVKSEFISDALDKMMNFKKFYNLVGKIYDTRPSFSHDEMLHICRFLMTEPITSSDATPAQFSALENTSSSDIPAVKDEHNVPYAPITKVNTAPTDYSKYMPPAKAASLAMQCKHCGACSALAAGQALFTLNFYKQPISKQSALGWLLTSASKSKSFLCKQH